MRCDRPVPGMHPRVCCRLRQTLHLAVPGYRATLQSHGRHVNLQASLQREALDADILYTPDIPLQPFSSPQLEPRAMPGTSLKLKCPPAQTLQLQQASNAMHLHDAQLSIPDTCRARHWSGG